MKESLDLLRSVAQDQDGYIGYDEFATIMRQGSIADRTRREEVMMQRIKPRPTAVPTSLGDSLTTPDQQKQQVVMAAA